MYICNVLLQAARGCLYRRECPYGYRNLISFFFRYCHPHLPSLSSLCQKHLVHLSSRDHFMWLHILCSYVDPSPSNTSMHPTSPAISPSTQPWSPDYLCTIATIGSLFWIPWIEPLTYQLRAVESKQSPDEHQLQNFSQLQLPTRALFFMSLIMQCISRSIYLLI